MFVSASLPQILLVVISIAIVLLTIQMWRQLDHHIQSSGPTLLTTIGIFGCFLGIAIGLLNFDTSNVQGSIPQLISGIRLSFWSSVMGIGCALLIKCRTLFLASNLQVDEHIEGATVDDLARLLSELKLSIAGTEESTLIGQTKLLRQDINDRLDRLQKSHERFAETLAENNSKAFIQALQEAISSFNEKLTEQLGDNFKHLNQSVERMVQWQEQYKEQMAEMIQQQQICTTNMTEATRRYTEIVGYAEAFANVSSKLSDLLTGLETQRHALESSLKSLAELLTTASSSLPEIELKILEMAEQISNGVRASNAEMSSMITTISQSLQTSHAEMKKLLTDVIRSANQELNGHIRQMSEETKDKVVALDKALNDELTKSLTSLGQQLATLSSKFVDDYSPLTDKLREVVQLANNGARV